MSQNHLKLNDHFALTRSAVQTGNAAAVEALRIGDLGPDHPVWGFIEMFDGVSVIKLSDPDLHPVVFSLERALRTKPFSTQSRFDSLVGGRLVPIGFTTHGMIIHLGTRTEFYASADDDIAALGSSLIDSLEIAFAPTSELRRLG